MNNQELLGLYEKGLSAKGQNRHLYLKYATDFLNYVDGQFDRKSIDKYLDHLRNNKQFADGTIDFAFRVIRALFNRSGLEWPYLRGESPQIREEQVFAPALAPDCVKAMICAARDNCNAADRAYFALSTTYGLRRAEMANITSDDINLNDRTIRINSGKLDQERIQLIPDEIVQYLQEFDFKKKASLRDLLIIWARLEHFSGIKHSEGVGWHSIRRTLDTLLLESGVPGFRVMDFLRWKQGSSLHLPYRYSAKTFVGKQGTPKTKAGASLKRDKYVFARHPFLAWWK